MTTPLYNEGGFELTVCGITADVEPAEGCSAHGKRWEIRFDNGQHAEWQDLHCGDYPEVTQEQAREAATARLKAEAPLLLVQLRRDIEHIQNHIAMLEKENPTI